MRSSSKLGRQRNMAKLSPEPAKFGRVAAKFKRTSTKFGRCRPMLRYQRPQSDNYAVAFVERRCVDWIIPRRAWCVALMPRARAVWPAPAGRGCGRVVRSTDSARAPVRARTAQVARTATRRGTRRARARCAVSSCTRARARCAGHRAVAWGARAARVFDLSLRDRATKAEEAFGRLWHVDGDMLVGV